MRFAHLRAFWPRGNGRRGPKKTLAFDLLCRTVSNVPAAKANLPVLLLQGQEDRETGAFRYQVFDLDPAPVGLGNPLTDG